MEEMRFLKEVTWCPPSVFSKEEPRRVPPNLGDVFVPHFHASSLHRCYPCNQEFHQLMCVLGQSSCRSHRACSWKRDSPFSRAAWQNKILFCCKHDNNSKIDASHGSGSNERWEWFQFCNTGPSLDTTRVEWQPRCTYHTWLRVQRIPSYLSYVAANWFCEIRRTSSIVLTTLVSGCRSEKVNLSDLWFFISTIPLDAWTTKVRSRVCVAPKREAYHLTTVVNHIFLL